MSLSSQRLSTLSLEGMCGLQQTITREGFLSLAAEALVMRANLLVAQAFTQAAVMEAPSEDGHLQEMREVLLAAEVSRMALRRLEMSPLAPDVVKPDDRLLNSVEELVQVLQLMEAALAEDEETWRSLVAERLSEEDSEKTRQMLVEKLRSITLGSV